MSLTDAGTRLLEHTVNVLGHVAAAEQELRAIAGLEAGALRIGAFLTACTSFVPTALGRFQTAHPGVEVELLQLEPDDGRRALRAGDIDLAVVWRVARTDGRAGLDDVESVHLTDDHYRFVLPADHKLARRRELRLADLARERFVTTLPGTPYRALFDELCVKAGFTPELAYQLDDVNVARALVAAGLCVALLPGLAVPLPRPDVAVKPVKGIAPFRSVHAIWMGRRRVPAVAPMVRMLETAAAARLRT